MATSSSGISFGGLFSGLDTESIISQLLKIERQPINLLETQKKRLGFKKDDLTEVNNSLLTLKATLTPFLNDIATQNKATSSDEKVVRVSADVSAAVGTYAIEVLQQAYQHRVASNAQAPAYTVAGAQNFNLTIGADTYTVALAGGETLTQVAQSINNTIGAPGGNAFSDAGSAFVISDPITGNQTLMIESDDTGTANAITFADTTGWMASVGLVAGAAWKNVMQAAQNASVKIDGVTVNSSTNTFTGAITGVTLTAEGIGTADVTIGADDDTIVSQVKAFVDAFNKSTELLDKYVLERPAAEIKTDDDLKLGVLQGDIDLVDAKGQIRIRTTGYVDGTGLAYKILSDLGIESEASVGSIVSDKISLDENKLRAALSSNRADASQLLENFATEMDDYLEAQTKVSVVQETAGAFYQRILGIDTQVESIDEDISRWEDRVASEEDRLRTSFSLMEQLLQQLQTQGSYLSSQLNNLVKATSSSGGLK